MSSEGVDPGVFCTVCMCFRKPSWSVPSEVLLKLTSQACSSCLHYASSAALNLADCLCLLHRPTSRHFTQYSTYIIIHFYMYTYIYIYTIIFIAYTYIQSYTIYTYIQIYTIYTYIQIYIIYTFMELYIYLLIY